MSHIRPYFKTEQGREEEGGAERAESVSHPQWSLQHERTPPQSGSVTLEAGSLAT